MKNEKHAYVAICYTGSDKTHYWPYPEAQDFTIYDLSDSVIWLTDAELEELEKLEKKL